MAEIKIDKDKCKGCGLCVIFCPLQQLELSTELNTRGVRYAQQKKDALCSGCGACYVICPDFCIEIYEQSSSRK